jgi:hypothetical protein
MGLPLQIYLEDLSDEISLAVTGTEETPKNSAIKPMLMSMFMFIFMDMDTSANMIMIVGT